MSGKTIALRATDKSNAHIDPSREFDSWEEEFGFFGCWGVFSGSLFFLPPSSSYRPGNFSRRREERREERRERDEVTFLRSIYHFPNPTAQLSLLFLWEMGGRETNFREKENQPSPPCMHVVGGFSICTLFPTLGYIGKVKKEEMPPRIISIPFAPGWENQ